MLSGHTDTVSAVIQLKDFRVASASFDKTIRVAGVHGSARLIVCLGADMEQTVV